MIAIIGASEGGNDGLRNLIARLLPTEEVLALQDVTGLESRACGNTATGVIVEDVTLVHSLRAKSTARFVGPLLVLSFAPESFLKRRISGEALETKGVAVLRMPFLAKELQSVLEQTPALSEAEWTQVNHELRRNDLKKQAAQLRHRSDSAFSTALTALYELEKLSYFKAPEREHIRQNLEVVRTGLAVARVNEFEKQVNALAEEAGEVGCLDRADREMIPTTFERLRGYGTLVEQALTVDEGTWALRCREAASIRQALKDVLDLLTMVGKSCGK